MILIEFPEMNVEYAKDQPEYNPLPAYKFEDGRLVCCWSLSWKERLKVLFTGKIWHQILTFNRSLQPQLLTAEKPKLGNRR